MKINNKEKTSNYSKNIIVSLCCFVFVFCIVLLTDNAKDTYAAGSEDCPSGYIKADGSCSPSTSTAGSTTTSSTTKAISTCKVGTNIDGIKCGNSTFTTTTSSGTCTTNGTTYNYTVTKTGNKCSETENGRSYTYDIYRWTLKTNTASTCKVGTNIDGIKCGNSTFTTTASSGTCTTNGTTYNYTVTKTGDKCSETENGVSYTYDIYKWTLETGSGGGGGGGGDDTPVSDTPASNSSSNISTSPNTGTVMIFFVWILGILTIGYSVWYYKKNYSNK